MTFTTITNDQLKMLKQEIQDNIEWLETMDFSLEVECIAIENLEAILTRFFHRKISLTLG